MPDTGSCSLHWADYVPTVAGMLRQFYQEQDFTDVTLVCDDGIITAHSIVLSACSPFFSSLLKNAASNPISIRIANTTASNLQSLLALLYCGEVIITGHDLDHLLSLASQLQISCLITELQKMADQRDVPFIDLDELFDFYEEEVFTSNELSPPHPSTSSFPVFNFQEQLKDLIKTSLMKEEVKDGKECWHCLCCDKRWVVTKKNAYRHMETHLPEQECDKCDRTFSNREALNVHTKKIHNNNNESETRLGLEIGDEYEIIEKANDVVDEDKSYSDQMNLLTTFKMTRMMTDDSTAWCCLVCGKSWIVKKNCRRHMETHLVGVTLPCGRCGKSFGSKNSLRQHTRNCFRKDQTLAVVKVELEEAA